MFYTNTFVGGEVNVVGEKKKKGNKKHRNKQGAGDFNQVPIAHQYM
tara:strand:- start:179 stop:316 length:138 start_codon:yes stop_codon:yes gene_type:complete